jgi:hypothetical protein
MTLFALNLVILFSMSAVFASPATTAQSKPQSPPIQQRTKVDITITGDMVHASTVNSLLSVLESQTEKYRFYAEVRSSSNLVHLRSALLTEWYALLRVYSFLCI